jgi:FkbM family methyltransferase
MADCMIRLPSNHPSCYSRYDEQDIAAQASYFAEHDLEEFRNSNITETLAPEVVFNPGLDTFQLASPADICNGENLAHVMKNVAAELRQGCHLFDVGANVGEYTTWLLRNSPRQCHVFSYEPVPSTFSVLRRKFKTHQRVRTFHRAVADTSGPSTVTFRGLGDRGASLAPWMSKKRMTSRASVMQVTLDNEISRLQSATKIPFIKIDVEGIEMSVLRGLKQSLESQRVRAVLWERNPKKHRCICKTGWKRNLPSTQLDRGCACPPRVLVKDEVDFFAGFGYHVYLPGTKHFLRVDGRFWNKSFEVDMIDNRKSLVINFLAVAPSDPSLAYIVEKLGMLKSPGVFLFS